MIIIQQNVGFGILSVSSKASNINASFLFCNITGLAIGLPVQWTLRNLSHSKLKLNGNLAVDTVDSDNICMIGTL